MELICYGPNLWKSGMSRYRPPEATRARRCRCTVALCRAARDHALMDTGWVVRTFQAGKGKGASRYVSRHQRPGIGNPRQISAPAHDTGPVDEQDEPAHVNGPSAAHDAREGEKETYGHSMARDKFAEMLRQLGVNDEGEIEFRRVLVDFWTGKDVEESRGGADTPTS